MSKKTIKIIILGLLGLFCTQTSSASVSLSARLAGRILLQVQSNGEAWYVNPADQKRYSLGRPSEAFTIMRELSAGITNANLEKISVGIIDFPGAADDDNDGLSNDLETAIGTDPEESDSDNDGYNDLVELNSNYNPVGSGYLPLDNNFINQSQGKIFLQTESRGEAWYVNPADQKRYFLGRPIDAFNIMKKLSLGITNDNLNKIEEKKNTITNQPTTEIKETIYAAADALRSNDANKFKSYFITETKPLAEYIMNNFSSEQRLVLGNILSGAKLLSSTEKEKIYSNEIYFSLGGYKVPVNFMVKKQSDGTWLLTNL